MTFIRYFLFAALTPILIIALIGFYLQPITGDLTRVGNVSERSWGWNAPKAAISIKENDSSKPAQVLVIGDSFSIQNSWQSAAAEFSGNTFLTYHWNDIGGSHCLEEAVRDLVKSHPEVRYVVFELIERGFIGSFGEADKTLVACKPPIRTSVKGGASTIGGDRKHFEWSELLADPIYSIKALFNEKNKYDSLMSLDQAKAAPLSRSDLFSNRRSDAILFLGNDLEKQTWTQTQIAQALSNIEKISSNLSNLGVVPIFVIVPDKLTTYAPFLANGVLRQDLPNAALDLSHGKAKSIYLNALFQDKATHAVDFYLPNDTHLSSDGFIFLGQQIGGYINNLKNR